MTRVGGWNTKKQKKYKYEDKIILATNKPEAAYKLNLTFYKDIAKIKKVK